ncbi:RbsD/FucU family protein [Salinisphaera sp. Q1T1-3]|uniref:RbsD/FucU family protein n=1 Tax=Salinisphaera sp. Q1T1-3 TaxID=2321229 RepID=UPI000E711586|nr:RbsD/FucU domain-containing protein [Salinisphaera sp. Q1T1-3]RJS93256.1 ribose ABC transporter [Salinisphaera sp. Q1T1-3]
MLKNINPLLTGDLLGILADMGHGDEIVVVDANFPAAALAGRLVRLPSATAPEALGAILELMPIDDFIDPPTAAMQAPQARPAMYETFGDQLRQAEGREVAIDMIERFAFYERTRQAYAVVATSERRLYGNILLTKGVVRG